MKENHQSTLWRMKKQSKAQIRTTEITEKWTEETQKRKNLHFVKKKKFEKQEGLAF